MLTDFEVHSNERKADRLDFEVLSQSAERSELQPYWDGALRSALFIGFEEVEVHARNL